MLTTDKYDVERKNEEMPMVFSEQFGGDYLERSRQQARQAEKVIDALGVVRIWEESGARVNSVGSFKLGLLAKHLDIDFHIYTQELDIDSSFKTIAKICSHPQVKKCEFVNLANTEEACYEWHVWYEDEQAELWQIDMIQILAGSRYDGYFETVAAKIAAEMTEKQRQIILKLKFETPDDIKISGIEYYKAVIQDGIETFDALSAWRQMHQYEGIIEW